MVDRDATIEAYQILADLLVTIRRVIHRGLERVSGKKWYVDGCPPGMFDELVARKEGEMAVDRFGGEYQELITFASLDDLAAIIEYNGELARLLASLEPEGAPMIDRLREIEALRLKMAASVPFDDADLEAITRYHREFRETLTRRKTTTGTVATAPEDGAEGASGSATQDPPSAGRDAAVGERISSGSRSGSAPGGAGREFTTQAATFEELATVDRGGTRLGRTD